MLKVNWPTNEGYMYYIYTRLRLQDGANSELVIQVRELIREGGGGGGGYSKSAFRALHI